MSKKNEWSSYVDEVKVKIHENYKPPPKISLVMTHNQTLALNKKIIENLPKYDFVREKNVLKMCNDWQASRSKMLDERKAKLDKINEQIAELKKKTEEEMPSCSFSPEAPTSNVSTMSLNFSNILQPTPLGNINSTVSVDAKSPFNISEFETDTSSPFDNVALKSINDMEELAKVLKIEDYAATTSQYSYSNFANHPVYVSNPLNSYTNVNGFYSSSSLQSIPATNYESKKSNYMFLGNDDNRTFNNVNYTSSSTTTDLKNVADKKTIPDLPNPFNELPKNLQDLSKSINLMGFPLDRVARTCKIYGDDNKKVIEHLLAMSQLLDLGFPEKKVTEALLQFDNDRDKALDKLVS